MTVAVERPHEEGEVYHQFETREQQHETWKFGMWVFLASEVMMFGAMFTAYAVLRQASPAAFEAASAHMNMLLGSINTAILITSCLTMSLAVQQLQKDNTRASCNWLLVTLALGLLFLGFKFWEYAQHIHEGLWPGGNFIWHEPNYGRAELFFWLYYVLTGAHATHMLIGCGLVGYMAWRVGRRTLRAARYTPLEMVSLYWHFVDVVWTFLFPFFYLPGMHHG
jgi:cytochrome c oxidase subunit 3